MEKQYTHTSKDTINSMLYEYNLPALKTDASNTYNAFKHMIKNTITLIKKAISIVKIPELVMTILSFTRSIPLIGRLIPNPSSQESRIKEMLSVTEIGDIVTVLANINQFIFSSIWALIPLSNKFKTNIILPIFNYNDRLSFMRSLYRMMVDSSIPPKYAKAYIIIMTLRIPIYNILYVFKSFWTDTSKSKPTLDDKTHPFTSGNPVYNKDTGMNETETKIHKRVQKFIQAYKVSSGEVESNYRLTRIIIKDALLGIVIPFLLPMFNFFRISFGTIEGESPLLDLIDSMIKVVLMIYYYYFLITAMVLSSLALDKEEEHISTN